MFSPSAIQRQRFQKVVLIFLFLLLSVALIITWNTPATGYESSIYRSTPLILWVSLIASVVVGVALVVVSIAKNELDRSPLCKIGLLLVFLCYTICLALFIIRGYHMWCMTGDPASHIGWIKETLGMGHTPTSMIYPATHIWLSEIIYIADLDLVFLHKIVPLIFGLLCILFMYVFASALFSKPAEALLAGVISCSLAFGYYLNLTPNGLANLFLPFALFLVVRYLQQKAWPWAVALSAVILLYPVFHPVPTIFLGIVFLTLWIPPILPEVTKVLHARKIGDFSFNRLDLRLVLPFLILLIWFIFWISLFSMWDWTIKSMYQTICSEQEPSAMLDLVNQISYAQGYGYNVIEQVIRRLWAPIILFVLSVISLPLLWGNFSQGRHDERLFTFYGPLGVVALVMPALYLFNLAFGPLRLMFYVSMLGTVFAAYFFVYLLTGERRSSGLQGFSLKTTFVILVIASLFLGGVLNLYPSPYNLTQSYQTTQSEVAGMAYIYEYRDTDIPLSGITIAPGRFAHALLTPEERAIQNLPMYLEDQDRIAPWHFGYDRYASISSVYNEETDLAITQRDKLIYVDYFPDMAQYRFTDQDFEQLAGDPGINFLYSNGGFGLWKVTVMT
jgi:hypothetical protein